MTVRLAVVDLDRRTAVVRVSDDGRDEFPHVLRGTLAALFDEPGWHVVVGTEQDGEPRPSVREVLDQAREWAGDRGCRLTVAALRDVAAVTEVGADR